MYTNTRARTHTHMPIRTHTHTHRRRRAGKSMPRCGEVRRRHQLKVVKVSSGNYRPFARSHIPLRIQHRRIHAYARIMGQSDWFTHRRFCCEHHPPTRGVVSMRTNDELARTHTHWRTSQQTHVHSTRAEARTHKKNPTKQTVGIIKLLLGGPPHHSALGPST